MDKPADTYMPANTVDQASEVIADELIVIRPPAAGASLPLMIMPSKSGLDLIDWVRVNRAPVRATLLRHGAILFRGFSIESAEQFEQFIRTISGQLLEYTERSSPRSQVSGNIYTSTDYPPDQSIFLHSENSYQRTWPMKIFFYCLTPAANGGETPLADTRRILGSIPAEIKEQFMQKSVLYVRNFGNDIGLSWQTVFQTDDRSKVEKYCADAGIQLEWKDRNRLRTSHVREAITTHPVTGEPVWFNHAIFFHPYALDPVIREALLLVSDEEDLPYNTYYGDGSPIEPTVVDQIRSVYEQETVKFPWQAGDILMLDNMLAAHGRSRYTGVRKILVGMSEPSDGPG